MDIFLIAYVACLFCVGGILSGVTGFGGNLFALPLCALALDARATIICGALGGASQTVLISWLYRSHVKWREALILGCSGLCGVPLGIYFLRHAPPQMLFYAAAACVFIFLFWQAFKAFFAQPQKRAPLWAAVPAGLLGGIMNSATSMGGPPLVIFAFLRKWSKGAVIGGVGVAAGIQMVFAIPLIFGAGLFTRPIITYSLIAIMANFLGTFISIPLVKKINVTLFQRLLLGMLSLAGALLILKGIRA